MLAHQSYRVVGQPEDLVGAKELAKKDKCGVEERGRTQIEPSRYLFRLKPEK